ncbi:hypothetical protein SALBM217S_05801 [Streptomyces griseoloalbus]
MRGPRPALRPQHVAVTRTPPNRHKSLRQVAAPARAAPLQTNPQNRWPGRVLPAAVRAVVCGGAPRRSQGSRKSNARWKFCVGRPVPGRARVRRSPRGPLRRSGRGVGARHGLAGRAPLRPTAPASPSGGAAARPHPAAARGHGECVCCSAHPVHPGRARRTGRAAAPRRPVLAGPRPRRPVGGPGGLPRGRPGGERGFPEALDLLLRWRASRAAEPGRPNETVPGGARRAPPPDGVAEAEGPGSWSPALPASVRLAAERGRPMLLRHARRRRGEGRDGALWGRHAGAGLRPAVAEGAAHVSAGVCQIADRRCGRGRVLLKAVPGCERGWSGRR